uniref:Uncharacterized protein n=1 Tax=Anguilla anguilla TaxID=7936 RepID=A0A0E9UAM3_ANGAN
MLAEKRSSARGLIDFPLERVPHYPYNSYLV